MSVANPQLRSAIPIPVESGAVLRQPVYLTFTGPSLIDPRSWGPSTFAVYGPGDVIYDTGPGTILNSGIATDPYKLIDGITLRERVSGTFSITISGTSDYNISGYLGVSGTNVICTFVPGAPYRPNTQYEVVVVGDDEAGTYLEGSGRYLGVTSWTSNSYFTQSGPASSGICRVLTSYDNILPTPLWDIATGYNDTYSLAITSGSDIGAPQFLWSRAAYPGSYLGIGSGIHSLGFNLTLEFSGVIQSGQLYTLDVYIPKPLLTTYVWRFNTSEYDASEPPYIPVPPVTVIDETGGGFLITSGVPEELRVIDTWPTNLDYTIVSGLPCVIFQFNKTLDPYLVTSGYINVNNFLVSVSPLAGMPNIQVNPSFYPSMIQISGIYMFLWL
jgi:hypothetical protein